MNKVFIDTLGCAKNEYDSQILKKLLEINGFDMADNPQYADIFIVNTCGFIEAAKMESIEHILEMGKLKNKEKKLIVTGCLSERYKEELLKEFPEVDIMVGVNEYDNLPDLLRQANDDKLQKRQFYNDKEDSLPYRKRKYNEGSYHEVLKIAEGCNNSCAFCAIPKIRGKYRSKKMEDVIREAQDMAESGIKEISIIAQDTSKYGEDLYGNKALPELLERLAKIPAIKRIRLMYVYDEGITDDLIDVIKREDKICKYIDIPLQHISNEILQAMGRNSNSDNIRKRIKKLREEIKNIHIRTTLMVGFPGETEKDFKMLVEFIKEMKLDRVGCFKYSDEENTIAYNMTDKVNEDIKDIRYNRLMEAQQEISLELNNEKIGNTYKVIVDEQLKAGSYIGRTEFDAPEIDNDVIFTSDEVLNPGDFVDVKITDVTEYDLYGEMI